MTIKLFDASALNVPPAWRCFVCRKRGIPRVATIRVFSGTMGGGFAACDDHQQFAITEAMDPLWSPHIDPRYRVTAYRVIVTDLGYPDLGPRIFTARRRTAA